MKRPSLVRIPNPTSPDHAGLAIFPFLSAGRLVQYRAESILHLSIHDRIFYSCASTPFGFLPTCVEFFSSIRSCSVFVFHGFFLKSLQNSCLILWVIRPPNVPSGVFLTTITPLSQIQNFPYEFSVFMGSPNSPVRVALTIMQAAI